jgi:hydroxymethylpyrimidine pyrophosphatase-like HAD family hydrolase
MQFRALATDYDETLAHLARVDDATLDALRRWKASGRRVILVTGRRFDDLQQVFPRYEVCDAIVAENGALLWLPAAGPSPRLLAEPPSRAFLARLHEEGVPFVAGEVIVATEQPHDAAVLRAIRDLRLPLQIIYNKQAVMVLPVEIDKASGLRAALAALDLSAKDTVALGDAENDVCLLAAGGLGVAVANALPELKRCASLVTRGESSRGVVEVIEQVLRTGTLSGG